MGIETLHKGYKIGFVEYNEHWCCNELDVDSETLAGAKAAIDTLTRNDRRLNVKVLYVTGGVGFAVNEPTIEVVTAVLLATPRERRYQREAVEEVHILLPNGERKKVQTNNLFPLEARADLNRWVALCAVAEVARQDAVAAGKGIAHVNHDALALANREAKAAKAEAEA